MPTALITGASSGLGATFARQLAARGVDLILTARRQERLSDLAATLEAQHPIRCQVIPADLATQEGIADIAGHIESIPALDYLINNAGFGTPGLFFQNPAAPQETMHRLHIMATLSLTHAALARMVPAAQGSIINVSSVAGFALSAGSTSYNATKHWINVFTEGIHLELKLVQSPVRIQALCPGYTYTEFHDVLGMDRKLVPDSLWLKADDVVAESLGALDRNQLFVVPGFRYRWFTRLYPHLPRWIRHRAAIAAGRRMKRL